MGKKLIEVALPLEAINRESAREKSIRHGHPSTLHLWWARRPLAACRAVLFASLVDDPSSHPQQFPTEEVQERERQRLFRIIEDLVKWDNSNNELVLERARAEIRKSCGGNSPPVMDPFCGGGSIPLEAQRLGLEAYASDLNPVAVLITKALIEIPPRFANRPPVQPVKDKGLLQNEWRAARGLAEDVRYYGQWLRDEAEQRIGHLYPKVKLPKEYGGREATVIAWLWARTVKCPNPACGGEMPLLSSFVLTSKPGRERYLYPVIKGNSISFTITSEPPSAIGDPKKGYKRGISGIFQCAFCRTVTTRDYVASEGVAHKLGQIQTAVVAEGGRGRIYLPPEFSLIPPAIPKVSRCGLEAELASNPRDVWCRNFGLFTPADLFTPRQLVALTTFSDLVSEAKERVFADAVAAGLRDDNVPLSRGGKAATAYADAVATYLAFGVDKNTLTNCTQATWQSNPDRLTQAFSRQTMPMTWDYAEANPLSEAGGGYILTLESLGKVLERLPHIAASGSAKQLDATTALAGRTRTLISTDPPYYDNIAYADLSDFFYVWLRRSLGKVYPNLFSTLLTPKAEELVATPYRFGGDEERARRFFEEGLSKAFNQMRETAHPDYPLTVYYAFRQAETINESDNTTHSPAVVSTGWETMLEGLIKASFAISGTWPMRTELVTSLKKSVGALASSIVIVCRLRPESASFATRREFIAALKRELPGALKKLQHGNIAPVDLAQAAIGPGMGVFSLYAKVLEADGTPMRVRTALALINQVLDEVLAEQEGEFDSDTRWAVSWFEQFGFEEGPFGVAETLSRAKNTAVRSMVEAGILAAKAGKVQLLKRDEIAEDWDPTTDRRIAIWEVTQHLIRMLEQQGETGAAALVQNVGGQGEIARDLAYRLYGICERKKWAQEALAYNSLVIAWPEIMRLAGQSLTPMQEGLF